MTTAKIAQPELLEEEEPQGYPPIPGPLPPPPPAPVPAVKELRTVEASEGLAGVVERLAANPQVSIDALERVIALQERILHQNQRNAFTAAFAKMQPEIPEIDERGRIEVRGQLRSTYAPLEDIHKVIKPILKKYGFAIRHRTEWPQDRPGIIRIVGILSHEEGHSDESTFEAPMDRSEYRTDIQSMGSTVSYGRRYTTIDLLNISTRALGRQVRDDDGGSSGRPTPPDGYEDKWTDLVSAADEGTEAFDRTWTAWPAAFKQYTVDHNRQKHHDLKTRAAKATAAAKAKP